MSDAAGPSARVSCRLDSTQLGTQLARYQRLGRHAESVVRSSGQLLVSFSRGLPTDLLAHTLDVERRCCPFVHATYDVHQAQLPISVDTVDQDPRLDSLFDALTRGLQPH